MALFFADNVMLRNYFKLAIRGLRRNKVFSLVNMLGLSVGLATCLLITAYIFDEAGYDKHHRDGGRIYRIATHANNEDWAAMPVLFSATVKHDLPEVEASTRLLKFPDLDKMLLSYEHGSESRRFFEPNGYYVDSNFFEVLTYAFKYGDMRTALSQPNSIVLSDEIAKKLFGNTDPIGKAVKVGMQFGELSYTVRGVLSASNQQSHIPMGFFLSMKNGDVGTWVDGQSSWIGNYLFHTYVKLKAGTDPRAFEKKLTPLYKHYSGDAANAAELSKTFYIQPLEGIYLHSSIGDEIAANGSIGYLYILGSIAAFILVIACINFMNLATSRSEKRAREVGVRKVMGAERAGLITQFLGESIFMSLLAMGMALLIAQTALPAFNDITQKNLRLFDHPRIVFFATLLTVFTGLLAGLYPALYLSAFKPIAVLKGRMRNTLSAVMIRKGLVVFQFTISACLILGAIVIWQQLYFLRHQHLGFNAAQQIIIPLRSAEGTQNYTTLRDELLKRSYIRDVTTASSYPGSPGVISDMLFYTEGKQRQDNIDVMMTAIEGNYLNTLGLKLLYGRTFPPSPKADSNSIILNETAVRELGYTPATAVGKKIYYELLQTSRQEMEIVGVVKDFHFQSMHEKIKPAGFSIGRFANKYTYVIATLNIADYPRQLAEMERDWKKVNPHTPFLYSFLDQDFQRQYLKDELASRIVTYFTGIAIFVACLGLFGLAAFSAERRTREIGIRKVLGAKVGQLTYLLSKEALGLVMIAMVLGSAISWAVMNKWLQAFAYRIEMSWWMFLLAGSITMVIAILTVGSLALKAGYSNPVKNLRTE